jgi:hypothetical protein
MMIAGTTITRRFLSDPGHGWLRVPHSDLDALGIRDKITMFSYYNDRFAYLEEDCDLSTYMIALREAGVKINIAHSTSNSPSHIRRMNRFAGVDFDNFWVDND